MRQLWHRLLGVPGEAVSESASYVGYARTSRMPGWRSTTPTTRSRLSRISHAGALLSCLVAVLVPLVMGCAASGPVYVDAPPPQEGDALVYIYRNKSFSAGGTDAHFYVGDTKIADLSQGGYTWFHIRSGSYVLTQKWGGLSMMKDLSINVRWQAGSTYYYRFEVDGDFYVVAHRITWRLAEVSAAEAMPKLRERSLQPAYDLDKIWGNWPWLKPREEDKH